MPANAARNDGKPSFEDPALIKMSNQHTKLGQARSEESAPTKLNEQDNTHSVPVCAPQSMAPAQPLCRDVLDRGVHREPCSVPTVEGSRDQGNCAATLAWAATSSPVLCRPILHYHANLPCPRHPRHAAGLL